MSDLTITARVVSVPRGSWRWQNAYTISHYQPYRTRDGRWIWRSIGRQRGKWSAPQLRRAGISLDHGSLHNRPLSADDLRWFALG